MGLVSGSDMSSVYVHLIWKEEMRYYLWYSIYLEEKKYLQDVFLIHYKLVDIRYAKY
ncbi:hypothetical protein SAMN06264941_1115 [Methanohalophilus portucalensis FDF-1]|uniref:Uncharacterized protein n=1 Tax=Methanohalophilus portucalensis FDF-1 TaxID=523843 RepID=A0A1L9C2N8_9EURY|nr:hypothetical protein MPF_1647 [Methanohalophilus portucalensis FDF-1]SMH37048.1 hypothetical protein SAMN06264941_1115 [Methanohalophilus portucalensis FDF-1]